MFFAVFDDRTGDLEYANCGHNAALLLRVDGTLERLESTTTVIGVFPRWECESRFIMLSPGDLLVVYSDGVTESLDHSDEEFGEQRLIETIRRHRECRPEALISAVVEEVRAFSPHEQHDDITLIVARRRPKASAEAQ